MPHLSCFSSKLLPTLRFLKLMKIHYKHDAFRLFQNHWRPQLLISCLLVCSLIRCLRRRRGDWRLSLHFKEDFVRGEKQQISIVAHSLLSSKYNSYGWTAKELIVIRQKHTFSAIAVDCCTALELSQLIMRRYIDWGNCSKKEVSEKIDEVPLNSFPPQTQISITALSRK